MLPAADPARSADPWGPLARSYRWQEPLQARSTAALLRVLAPTDAETVLDVGGGVGHLARALPAQRRGRTVVVEPSGPMVAAGDYAGAAVVRADATGLPLATGSVDVVTATWLLHVLTDEQRTAAVAEVARVLRPGGRFGVTVPAVPRRVDQQLVRLVARAGARARGLRAFQVPTDLPALLTDHGLQVRHHARTGRGYLADVVVCTRAAVPR